MAAKVGPGVPKGAVGVYDGRRVGVRVGTGDGETAGDGVTTPLGGMVAAGPDTPSTRKLITIPDSLIS